MLHRHREHGEPGGLAAEVRGDASLERRHPAHRAHREHREHDHRGHLDHELHEIGPQHRPQSRRHRIEHRDDEADPDGHVRIHAERDREDLDHRASDPAEHEQVDGNGEVERAEAAQHRGRLAAISDLGELDIRHDPRAPPEPREEEDGEHPAHQEVPPEPVACDAVRNDEPGHDQRRIGGKGRRYHRGAGEPPRNVAAREEVLSEALAAALREVEADAGREREVRGDDRPVDRGEFHAAAPRAQRVGDVPWTGGECILWRHRLKSEREWIDIRE